MNDAQRRRLVPLLLHRRLSTAPAAVPPPRLVSLRTHPVLFISTFLMVHQSITTLALIPAYSYFRFTDTSPAFLTGPYTAFILRQRVPFLRGDRTVEDVAEVLVQRTVKVGWRMLGKWRGRKVTKDEENEVAEEVLEGLEGKKRWRDTLVERSRGGLDRVRAWKEARAERASNAEMNGATMDRTDSRTGGRGTLRTFMDITAAYLVVKAIFPVRLAASLLLAPRFARAFGRRWG